MNSLKLFYLLLIVQISSAQTITLTYDTNYKDVQQSLCETFKKCAFECNVVEQNEMESKLILLRPPANKIKIIVEITKSDSNTIIAIPDSSFLYIKDEIKIRKCKDFQRIVYQLIDQAIMKDNSIFHEYKISSLNSVLYKSLSLSFPEIAAAYFINNPLNPKSGRVWFPILVAGIDGLGVMGIVLSDLHPNYNNKSNKHNNIGIILGSIILIGNRLLFAFGNNDGIKFINNFSQTGYGLTWNIPSHKTIHKAAGSP